MRILSVKFGLSLVTVLTFFCFFSCKEEVIEAVNFHPLRMEYGGSYQSIQGLRNEAKGVYELRMSQRTMDHMFLVDDWWHLQAYSEIDQIKDLTDGAPYWLKLNADNTYQYGIANRLEGKGLFHYRDSDSSLLLIDDNPRIEPTEFDLRYASDKMVFIGRSSMNVNNSTQIMMVLLSNPPTLH